MRQFLTGIQSATRALIAQIATPATPPAAHNAIYPKTDGQIYTQTPAGVESMLNDTETFVFSRGVEGAALVVGVGVKRLYLGASYRLAEVRASVGTAPTGATLIVDVNKNGSTLYGTQGNRPTVAISGFAAVGGAASVTTFAAGDYLTVDLDQVGSSSPGTDLVVAIRLQRTG